MTKQITYKQFQENLKKSNFNVAEYHWQKELELTDDRFLYFVVHDKAVKIGSTKDVRKRMKELKTSFSRRYQCYVFPNKGNLEFKFHFWLGDFRLEGEWFRYNKTIKNFLHNRLADESCYIYNETIAKEESEKNRKFIDRQVPFGKYKGLLSMEVFDADPEYLVWLKEQNPDKYEKSFNKSLKAKVEEYINNK